LRDPPWKTGGISVVVVVVVLLVVLELVAIL